ncbi:endolytic transglycosylase MltG [Sulfurovum sp. bin170]|uniref:endolytic transglycosylase MltG n=1 Tax=Sulfurovum sp. bin170 TaxID=2695268 RepID=UPI0013E01406|nr:endolytic transglycosylase MltG [Sulfurovum sp. bin170]NEW60585.1 endolytic transglycosylase MltG [Sulfurovum sp. bin170]
MKIPKLLFRLCTTVENLFTTALVSMAFYITTPIGITTDTLKLPKGSITNTINHLQNSGVKLSKIDIYLLATLGQPKHGELDIGIGIINRIDFLDKLTTASEAIQIITLIPGETRPIFLEDIAKRYKLDYKRLDSYYNQFSNYKEAGIIPDTYHVPKGIKEEKIISFLVELSEKKYEKLAKKHLKRYDKKEWLKYLTIASIVQKESANSEEMPIVASVVYNRLKIDMALQMDGTLNYGKYSHTKVTPKRIKTDKSGFNTYANKGLPPYPVCSVSIDAIEAAIKPATTKYLYFMRNEDGVHDFTDSYKEHLNNINRVKRARN